MKKITIGKFTIGANHPSFIIAEVGVNHNGDMTLAKKLVVEAKKAGADCVKFQTFKAKRLVTANASKAKYQLLTTNPKESQLEMLRKLELNVNNYKTLMALCVKVGILFLSTPYNFEDVDFLDSLGVKAFKLASMHLTELPTIYHIAKKGKPMLLSTGMSTLKEVKHAVKECKRAGNKKLIILQCTTNYPSKLEDANLLAIPMMRIKTGCLIGYSDHVPGINACIGAASLNACVIEKHFTIDTHMSGPDHSSSSSPQEFAQMVKAVREIELLKGNAIKKPTPLEKINMKGMRRSLVALTSIKKGTRITARMIGFKRPANGLNPNYYDRIIGKAAKKDILLNEILKKSLIQW